MAEVFRFLMKLLYLSGFIIIYALFNLFASSSAYFRKKNTPGNKDIFLSVLCSLITIPMLFTSYPLAIITWIVGLVLLFIGSKKNHEANDDSNPTFYFINVTFGALIAVFMIVLFFG
mgnify:CR=1 FL=1